MVVFNLVQPPDKVSLESPVNKGCTDHFLKGELSKNIRGD